MSADGTGETGRSGPTEDRWSTPPPPPSTPPPPPPASSAPARSAAPPAHVPVTPAGAGGSEAGRVAVSIQLSPGLVLGVVAVAAIVLGLLLDEAGDAAAPSQSLWDRTSGPLWSIAAIAAAVATLAPSLRSVLSLTERVAWIVAAVAAGYLAIWWVLFVLPYIELNVSFLATLGVAAAVAVAWIGPARPTTRGDTGS